MNQAGSVEPQRHSISAYLMKLPYFPFWQKKDFPFEVLWCLAVALQIAVVFAAPLFPSQDGPMHLYYVDVLRSVLTGKGAHTKYYALHHPLPPYLFQYALTLLMECFWTPLVAEKIMVALYAVWFAIATRYLARSIGPGWRLAALISVAFALNRWVYMGFFNFDMGLATALFLIGYWSRHVGPVLTVRKALVFSVGLSAAGHDAPCARTLRCGVCRGLHGRGVVSELNRPLPVRSELCTGARACAFFPSCCRCFYASL